MTEKIQTRLDGGIRWLVYNQPEKRNAISLDMSVKAYEIVDAFARSDTERVLVVTGAGDKAFVSGADISEFEEKRNSAAAAKEYQDVSMRMFQIIRNVQKPTVAMIHGYCFGGGVALAACCDLRFAADDALFSVPAAKLGIGYRVDFTRYLVELVGPAFAKEFLYTGRRFDATEACQMGFLNKMLPKASLEAHVKATAETIAENAPLSVKAAKVIVGEILNDRALRDDALCERVIEACSDSEDYRNARRAFMEKKKPVFLGR